MQYTNKHGYCIFQPNRTKIGRRLRLVDTEQPPMNPVIYASHHGYMEDAVAKNTIPARTYRKSRSLTANAHGRSFPLRTTPLGGTQASVRVVGGLMWALGRPHHSFLQLLSLFECNKYDPKLKLANYAPKTRMRNQMSCFCQIWTPWVSPVTSATLPDVQTLAGTILNSVFNTLSLEISDPTQNPSKLS